MAQNKDQSVAKHDDNLEVTCQTLPHFQKFIGWTNVSFSSSLSIDQWPIVQFLDSAGSEWG